MTDAADITAHSLDSLAGRWLEGDREAESRLFEDLHVRFLAVAKRRVREDDVEDVVQDALKTVLDRYGTQGESPGILVWGYTVLRNVIGNHYQARAREQQRRENVDDLAALPEASAAAPDELEIASEEQRLANAIADLGRRYPRCGTIFRAILASLGQGGSPREITARALVEARRRQPGLERNAFYVALHRCRGYLREQLATGEGGADRV